MKPVGALLAAAAMMLSPVALAQDQPSAALPSLEERDLGEPYLEEGERVIYGRALPFLAQEVLEPRF